MGRANPADVFEGLLGSAESGERFDNTELKPELFGLLLAGAEKDRERPLRVGRHHRLFPKSQDCRYMRRVQRQSLAQICLGVQ